MSRRLDAPLSLQQMVGMAADLAVNRTNGTPDAIRRVRNATERRLVPVITEAHSIADQLRTPGYIKFVQDTRDFLGAFTSQIACPDGRIIVMAVGDPKVLHMERSLAGIPDVRSTGDDFVPRNVKN